MVPIRSDVLHAVAQVVKGAVGDTLADEADVLGRLHRQDAHGWRITLHGEPTTVILSEPELQAMLAMIRVDAGWDGAP
jgi:hypothetical protein